jgi:hypothetical protein
MQLLSGLAVLALYALFSLAVVLHARWVHHKRLTSQATTVARFLAREPATAYCEQAPRKRRAAGRPARRPGHLAPPSRNLAP